MSSVGTQLQFDEYLALSRVQTATHIDYRWFAEMKNDGFLCAIDQIGTEQRRTITSLYGGRVEIQQPCRDVRYPSPSGIEASRTRCGGKHPYENFIA
jgi:hypothetical protein